MADFLAAVDTPDDIDNLRDDADDRVEVKPRLRQPCPSCGGVMHITETFKPGELPRSRGPPWQVAA